MTDALRPATGPTSGNAGRLDAGRQHDAARQTPAADRGQTVWLSWVLHTVVGHLLAGILVAALLLRASGRLTLAPAVGMAGLAAVALLQWRVLRRHRPAMRWWSWLLATLIGQVVGSLAVGIGAVASIFLSPFRTAVQSVSPSTAETGAKLVAAGLLGAALGFAQWLVLRRHLSAAGWWIPATAVAGALAGVVPSLAELGVAVDASAAQIIGRLVTGVIVGAITGVALVRLLARPRSPAGGG